MSSALTSLLNSLHTHLQTQTQLLPTLHLQLGLPSTALDDELKTIQDELIQSVDVHVDARRKEVDGWMEKCEEVERECMRHTHALGGNIKATGSSLGELRKERVLPRRYELASEYREKLRQIYHSKLEQLTTLTNRLNALSHTLGRDFYPPDILELMPAIGENANGACAHKDVTPERFSLLEKELVRGKGEVTKRLHQLSATMVQIDWLYTELGIPQPTLDELPSSSGTLRANSDPFLCLSTSHSTPTPSSRTKTPSPFLFLTQESPTSSDADYQQIFARFAARIEEAEDENLPEGSGVPIGLENVEPTYGLMTWANSTRASLEDMKKQREAHIQAMYDQLEGLWRRLGVSEGDMDMFVEAHRGSTEETVREYEEELERMLELKRERMGAFIESAREEILKLWDDLMIGDEERADFAPFADDEHTEELLSIHEEEIKRLKEERRMKAPLLASIKKYFEICEEEKELAAAASDQSRLLGRGHRDPGRLLREEKMRKRVSKEKPRLEQDLLASIPAWEDDAGRPFLVHGESIQQILMEAVSAADQENRGRQTRSGSVPGRSTTPVNSLSHYVPTSAGYCSSKTGAVVPAVRPGSSMGSNSAPSKRQRVGEPTSVRHVPSYSGHQRAPLGTHRGQSVSTHQHRAVSPGKSGIPGKTPTGGSSLPRPVAMPIPKAATQHHFLGHGRLPANNGVGYGAGYYQPSQQIRNSSTISSMNMNTRVVSSASGAYQQSAAKKASRARRESFKPRTSGDGSEIGVGVGIRGRWGGLASSVKEED